MKYSLVLFLLILVAVNGKLSWRNLSRKNFTKEHNEEMLKAYAKDPEYARVISKIKNRSKSITMEETIFTLFTRSAPDGVTVTLKNDSFLTTAKFDPGKKTFFLTHGFLSGADAGWVIEMKTIQLEVLDCNFFTIDWSACAATLSYPDAIDCLPSVGKFTSQVLNYLHLRGTDFSKVHLIGHSLGAHLVAQVSLHNIQVKRITGLDPAGPLFNEHDTDSRVDPGDAIEVDVIHTSRDAFGYEKPMGRWDFYPNGGHLQPGCFQFVCDHSMAHKFYAHSIKNNSIYPGLKCASLNSALQQDCSGPKNYMGVSSTLGPDGIYYCYLSPTSFNLAKIILLFIAIVGFLLALVFLIVVWKKDINVRIFHSRKQKTDFFHTRYYH